jgi:hypothetical protein
MSAVSLAIHWLSLPSTLEQLTVSLPHSEIVQKLTIIQPFKTKPQLPQPPCSPISNQENLRRRLRLLVSHDPTREDQLLLCGLPPPCPSSSYHSAPPIVSIVTDQDRMKIVDWCYEIIDHCKMDRETVAVAMDIADRFFSNQSSYIAQRALLHCRDYQLASLHDNSLPRD